MTISGFTIIRNAINYDFPVVESITSMLCVVDELVVVLGDSVDNTDEIVNSINSNKIKIIKSNWDSSKYNKDGQVYAAQTDIALKACKGDWCIYLQADEVLHEDAAPIIRRACEKYLNNKTIEGFLLRYVHLYADYNHYVDARHFGYPKEVRIVRNIPDMHSWRDAQSFRIISNFDGEDYWQKKDTKRLNCILLDGAYIYHYGWCRNPLKMVKKKAEQEYMHSGTVVDNVPEYHDFGNISLFPILKTSHPAVMRSRIESMDWSQYLRETGEAPSIRKIFGRKYRILKFIENNLLPEGARIFGFKNYNQVGIFKR